MKAPCHRGHEIRLDVTEMFSPAPQGFVDVTPVQGTMQLFVLGVQVVSNPQDGGSSAIISQISRAGPKNVRNSRSEGQPPRRPETTESRRPRPVN
jgi:hypothetical protein